MQKKVRKLISVGMSMVLLMLCASCSFENKEMAIKTFKNRDKICYSSSYTELKANKRNSTQAWRDGMFSGNGEQGFITSGAPYSDSVIFQNAHFVMPTGTQTADGDEDLASMNEVRQALVNGESVQSDAQSELSYEFHPGGALRITSEKQKLKKYLRYTDYETGEVRETFLDARGSWERKAFTSFADNVVITDIASVSGARTTLTLSFDDISTFANFGEGREKDARVRRIADDDGSYLAFLGHYPDDEGSALQNSGWLTFVYVTTEGGDVQTVELEKNEKTTQDVSETNRGVNITNAYAVRLISLSRRIDDIGDMETFVSTKNFRCVRDAAKEAREICEKYQSDGFFDYDKALKAHTDIYTPMFNAVSLALGESSALNSNEALIAAQKRGKSPDPAFVQRAYYAGRFLSLCCGGAMRDAGLWTGEFCPGWGGVYDLAVDAPLFSAGITASNAAAAPIEYTRFLLTQAPLWAENAKATHRFKNALQSPLFAVGDAELSLTAVRGAASRWWNAGTAMLLRPLYEAASADGALTFPTGEDFDLEPLRAVLSTSEEPLSEEACEELLADGTLRLREDVLLPLLMRATNYWLQLVSPAYYTDADGTPCYDADKTALSGSETYCLLPGYVPAASADAAQGQSGGSVTVNAAVDIAACRETLEMLLDVAEAIGLLSSDADKEDADGEEEETDDEVEEEEKADTELLVDFNACKRLLKSLPAYPTAEDGALSPWAKASSNDGDLLYGALACAWPFTAARDDAAPRESCAAVLKAASEETRAASVLLHRGFVTARLQDRSEITKALLAAEQKKLRSDSFLPNARTDGKGAVSAAYAAGFTALVNEALLQSDHDSITLLPCVPETGFDVGNVAGLRAVCGVTVSLMAWDLNADFVIVDLTSDTDQTIRISSPLSSDAVSVSLHAEETKTVSLTLDLTGGDAVAQTDGADAADPDAETDAPSAEDPYDAEFYDYGDDD